MSDTKEFDAMFSDFEKEALQYHQKGSKGKLAITATKPLDTRRDLSLAYSPGVAAACRAIDYDPLYASEYTARGNLIAVVSNGSAILGLGNLGPLASKPVMEGKAVLFKKFSGVDVFDLEVNESNIEKFCDIVAALEPTFGGINLEDIKAPECFEIEKRLNERMSIPVFHDDQHGTAITVAAGVYNALEMVGKKISDIKIACSGAGAAALACLNMLVAMGADRSKILVCDLNGVVYEGRKEKMDPYKSVYAAKTNARTLDDAIVDADLFLGLSAPNVLTQDMVKKMAKDPLVFALSNPDPEIKPEDVYAVRDDAICATGRSDYPNQINNVLCFPFIFRGALDVGATTINEEMKVACVKAIASLARLEVTQSVADAYGELPTFGRDYILPKPFDSRLLSTVAPAVAKAAMETGVATRPIKDLESYVKSLERMTIRSGTVMKPIFAQAIKEPKKIVYCEGEEPTVLRAVQIVVDEKLASPVLIGRPSVIWSRVKKLGLRLTEEEVEICNPQDDPRYREYWEMYHNLMGRRGVSQERAKVLVRTEVSVIGSLMLQRGEVDGMLCGATGAFYSCKKHVQDIIGSEDDRPYSTVTLLVLPHGPVFITDTHGICDPNAEEVADITIRAKRLVRRFGIEPSVALISHSNFGSSSLESATKMSDALRILQERGEADNVDGEMHASLAFDEHLRQNVLADTTLKGQANLLVMPNMDAAHICAGLLGRLAEGVSVGPMVLGHKKPAHILTNGTTVRGIVNMTAVTVVEAQKVK